MMTCISARCTCSKFYFQSGLFTSTFVFAQKGTWSSFYALSKVLYRVCILFLLQGAKVGVLPGWTQRYLIKAITGVANHAATAHCRNSSTACQEPCRLELALSVLPIIGTESTQYVQGEKYHLRAKHPTTSKTESINRLNPPPEPQRLSP